MTLRYIANGDAWCMSLRDLMGYPLYEPACHAVAWAAAPSCEIVRAMQAAQLADEMEQDVVHVAFEDIVAGNPVAVSLVIRKGSGVEWLSDCRLYASAEFERIELLGGGRRWQIGPRFVLTSQKMPPPSRRATGEKIAMRRWRKRAAGINGNIPGRVVDGASKTSVDAVTMAELPLAA